MNLEYWRNKFISLKLFQQLFDPRNYCEYKLEKMSTEKKVLFVSTFYLLCVEVKSESTKQDLLNVSVEVEAKAEG